MIISKIVTVQKHFHNAKLSEASTGNTAFSYKAPSGPFVTSTKARLTTAAIWRITFPIDPNSDESRKQSLYPDGDPDRHQFFCSLAHCQPSLNFMQIRSEVFAQSC